MTAAGSSSFITAARGVVMGGAELMGVVLGLTVGVVSMATLGLDVGGAGGGATTAAVTVGGGGRGGGTDV